MIIIMNMIFVNIDINIIIIINFVQANVLSVSDGLFRESALAVAKQYPTIKVCICTHACTHTHTPHTHMHTHKYARTYTFTHTHTNAHEHKHMRTFTQHTQHTHTHSTPTHTAHTDIVHTAHSTPFFFLLLSSCVTRSDDAFCDIFNASSELALLIIFD